MTINLTYHQSFKHGGKLWPHNVVPCFQYFNSFYGFPRKSMCFFRISIKKKAKILKNKTWKLEERNLNLRFRLNGLITASSGREMGSRNHSTSLKCINSIWMSQMEETRLKRCTWWQEVIDCRFVMKALNSVTNSCSSFCLLSKRWQRRWSITRANVSACTSSHHST